MSYGNCNFTARELGGLACVDCGRIYLGRSENPIANCGRAKGAGDWTERQLSKAGITQDRYKAAKKFLGLAPTCNCSKKKKTLNAWHAKAVAWLAETKEANHVTNRMD